MPPLASIRDDEGQRRSSSPWCAPHTAGLKAGRTPGPATAGGAGKRDCNEGRHPGQQNPFLQRRWLTGGPRRRAGDKTGRKKEPRAQIHPSFGPLCGQYLDPGWISNPFLNSPWGPTARLLSHPLVYARTQHAGRVFSCRSSDNTEMNEVVLSKIGFAADSPGPPARAAARGPRESHGS